MTSDQRTRTSRKPRECEKRHDYCDELNDWGEDGAKVRVAVQESVLRFLEANQGNIERSDKQRIASASYGGGMIDTMMAVRNALGGWGLEQVLGELARMQKRDDQPETVRTSVSLNDSDGEQVASAEAVKDLGEKIVGRFGDHNGKDRKERTDPMFA